MFSPREMAFNSSGIFTGSPSNSAWPSSSNQSIPERTSMLMLPARRYNLPSASTCQPSERNDRTAAGNLEGASSPGESRSEVVRSEA